jgi:large subunit ribosomal protein L21
LLVDRLPYDEGKTFHPDLLLVGGDGEARIDANELKDQQVTARVAGHVLGKKITIIKHRQRTRYRRRKGHRSRLSQIEIESIGKKATRARATAKKSDTEKTEPAKETAKKKEGTT